MGAFRCRKVLDNELSLGGRSTVNCPWVETLDSETSEDELSVTGCVVPRSESKNSVGKANTYLEPLFCSAKKWGFARGNQQSVGRCRKDLILHAEIGKFIGAVHCTPVFALGFGLLSKLHPLGLAPRPTNVRAVQQTFERNPHQHCSSVGVVEDFSREIVPDSDRDGDRYRPARQIIGHDWLSRASKSWLYTRPRRGGASFKLFERTCSYGKGNSQVVQPHQRVRLHQAYVR